MRYIIYWIRWVFGAHTLFSGVNYFFNFFPPPPLEHSPAGPFIAALASVGLYTFIKVIEVAVGAALLLDVFVPLALLMEFPITVSIFYLDVIVDHTPRPTFMGSRELAFNVLLMAAYAGYYWPLLARRAPLREVWGRTAVGAGSVPAP